MKTQCTACAKHVKCVKPCQNAGILKIKCLVGCNNFRLCVDCNVTMVAQPGGKCASCDKGKTRREIIFEEFLREKAEAGVIPMYTNWDRSDKERDMDQCKTAFRVDFTYVIEEKGLVVFIEFDEHQHSGYDERCELRKMMELSNSHMVSRAACVRWIRYNPDGLKVGGKIMKVNDNERQTYFIERLQRALNDNDYTYKIEIDYLFYTKSLEMGKEEPYKRTERFEDLLDFHRWANKRLEKLDETAKEKGESMESRDAGVFVAQQADGIKTKYVAAVANAAVESAGGEIKDDSDDEDAV